MLLPVIVSLSANLIVAFFWFRDVGEPAFFVSQLSGAPHLWELHIFLALVVNLGTGFQFASVGFILTAAFFVLFSWGRATLPIHLPPSSISDAFSSEDEHRRTMLFVWMMVAIVFSRLFPQLCWRRSWTESFHTPDGRTVLGFCGSADASMIFRCSFSSFSLSARPRER
jgi:hypothetical protein